MTALSQAWLRPDVLASEVETRIGVFEAAAAACAENRQELPRALASELEREIVARRERWLQRWLRVVRDHDLIERFNISKSAGGPDSVSVAMLWMPIWILYYATKRTLGFGTTSRLRRALGSGVCPDCGYSLVTAAFSGSERLKLIGPKRCAECGSKWPLVPPPNAGEPIETAS